MKNKKNRIYLLLILLLGISIGFAALATTLKINGTANIGKNIWDVHWANVDDIQKSSTTTVTTGATVDSNDNTKVNFEVTLNQPGDYYEFQVDAVNAGTLDAMAGIKSQTTVPSYVSLTMTYADGSEIEQYHLLPRAEDLEADPPVYSTERIKVRIEFLKSISEEDLEKIDENNNNLDIVIELPYGLADDNAKDRHTPSPVAFATDEWDVIAAEGNEAAKQTSTDGSCGVYNIGDTKTVDLGTLGTHTVRITNCSTPAVCGTEGFSQTACGFVVEFADIVDKHRMNAVDNAELNGNYNTGGWKYSDMRAYLNNGTYTNTYPNPAEVINYSSTGLLSKLPSALSDQIDDTTVVSGHGCKQSDYYDVCIIPDNDNKNFTTTDKLYLLSVVEVIGKVGNNRSIEFDSAIDQTRQLDYYELSGLTPDVNSAFSGQKTYNGSYDFWRTRTPYDNHYSPWYGIGDYSTAYEANSNGLVGVSPAFKLK